MPTIHNPGVVLNMSRGERKLRSAELKGKVGSGGWALRELCT
jgi:hypothetical protein